MRKYDQYMTNMMLKYNFIRFGTNVLILIVIIYT